MRGNRDLVPGQHFAGIDNQGAGDQLFDSLLAAVYNELDPRVRRLLIVPHGPLHALPFAALGSGRGDTSTLRTTARLALTVLPSASFLPLVANLPRPEFRPGRAVVLGDPTGDLRGAATEAVAVGTLLGTSPLIGAAATRAALLDVPPDTAIVHIAAHGTFDERDPLVSGIEMHDGRVTADDLIEVEHPPALLVMSACVTGMGQRRVGDELVGLVRAAAIAGTPSVLATLWKVNDTSAAVFFNAFYRFLVRGVPKDIALVQGQQVVREKGFNNPFHWAPYVLVGDPSPLR
jgi:CHAT domain-containing protein